MAIPGLTPTFELRAKVRIGEKKISQGGKEYPSSVDHFLCDDPAFKLTTGHEPKQLHIFLPFQNAVENFSTGLEWWRGKQLTCYSKGDYVNPGPGHGPVVPVAFRVQDMVGNARVVGEKMGKDRLPIECPVRDCEFMKSKQCKPMGRLQFWIDGIDRRAGVYQLDTKSWNSIENIEATLSLYPDLRGVPFVLRVEFTQRGRDRFPELYLEPEMEIKNDADVALADALVQLRKQLDLYEGDGAPAGVNGVKRALTAVLDLTLPGWRTDEEVIERLKAAGAVTAARKTLERYDV